jgi:hypothetical protein
MEYSLHTASVVSTLFRSILSKNKRTRNQRPTRDRAAFGWAQRLTRVFAIEIEKCEKCEKCKKCGGAVRIIASIEDLDVIQKILKHLGLDQREDPQNRSPPRDLTDQQTTLF